MAMPKKDKITESIMDRDLINKAFRESYYEVLKLHKQAGLPVVVLRDDKITWIKAEELLGDYLVKIVWLTDIHLNFVGRAEVKKLCSVILSESPDALLITGDIATSKHLCNYLEFLADSIRKPIYFVLGNHDYYGSSIKQVNSEVARTVKDNQYLIWLSRSGVIELSPDTCLIGHEGLADGRLGDPLGSTVELNDYRYIEELRQPTKELRLKVHNKLGDTAARHLRKQLNAVVAAGGKYKRILVALHVPPFPEACWHLGQNTDDNYLPHFACRATGVVLKNFAAKHPDISMVVYCGHTHSGGYAQILPNLKVHTAGAEYRDPRIAGIIDVERELPVYKLRELIGRITPENKHDFADFGKPVGKEIL